MAMRDGGGGDGRRSVGGGRGGKVGTLKKGGTLKNGSVIAFLFREIEYPSESVIEMLFLASTRRWASTSVDAEKVKKKGMEVKTALAQKFEGRAKLVLLAWVEAWLVDDGVIEENEGEEYLL